MRDKTQNMIMRISDSVLVVILGGATIYCIIMMIQMYLLFPEKDFLECFSVMGLLALGTTAFGYLTVLLLYNVLRKHDIVRP